MPFCFSSLSSIDAADRGAEGVVSAETGLGAGAMTAGERRRGAAPPTPPRGEAGLDEETAAEGEEGVGDGASGEKLGAEAHRKFPSESTAK